jgi:predicted ATPase/DNA-binding SARP family transcriptional activator
MNDPAQTYIFFFGVVRILQGGERKEQFRSQRAVALLIYLALQPAPVPRDELIELIWPDLPADRGRANLRWALSYWKKLLPGCWQVTRQTAAFDCEECRVDVHQLAAALADGDWQRVETAVSTASPDFCRGFFLDASPEFETWLLMQREYWRQQLRPAWQLLVDHYQAQGEYGRGLEYARRILELDTWQEQAQRQLILLLARSGDIPAALAQYESCREVLQRELGVQPQTETEKLFRRLQQVAERRRHYLPAQPTQFVGREPEIKVVRDLLMDPQHRLVTIVAPGGMGKTRLALAAAARLPGAFLDGIVFVPLAPVESPAALAATILETLQSAGFLDLPDTQQHAADFLIQALAEKELLLLLDNYEQLLPDIALLLRLLENVPGLKLLVTSRERLQTRWERPFPLSGLPYPPDMSLDWQEYSAPRLFLQCARRVHPPYQPTTADRAAIVQICQLVGGMPLALELAASWMRVHSPAHIAQEIAGGIAILRSSFRDMPPRQRSMRFVFAQSWARLTTTERQALAQMAIFHGPFSSAAAQAVTAADWGILGALVDKSLLRRLPAAAGGGVYFEIHELLRQFAAEQLLSLGMLAETQAQHGRYYAQLAETYETQLQLDDSEGSILRQIQREIENIRAAWEWAVGAGEGDLINQLLETIYLFYQRRTLIRDGLAVLSAAAEQLAEMAQVDAPHPPASLQLAYGRVTARLGGFIWLIHEDYGEAERVLRRSKEILEAVGQEQHLAPVLHLLGNATYQHELLVARGYWERSLAIYRRAEEQERVATILRNLCVTAPDYDTMIGYWRQAMETAVAIGDRRNEAHLYFIRGDREFLIGNSRMGEELAGKSISMIRKMNDPAHLILVSNILVDIYLAENRLADAQELQIEMEAAAQHLAIGFHAALVQLAAGRVALAGGDWVTAERQITAVLARSAGLLSHQIVVHIAHLQAGRLYFEQHRLPEARQHWQQVWEQVDNGDLLSRSRAWRAMVGIAESWFTEGACEQAITCLQQAQEVVEAIGALPAWEQTCRHLQKTYPAQMQQTPGECCG